MNISGWGTWVARFLSLIDSAPSLVISFRLHTIGRTPTVRYEFLDLSSEIWRHILILHSNISKLLVRHYPFAMCKPLCIYSKSDCYCCSIAGWICLCIVGLLDKMIERMIHTMLYFCFVFGWILSLLTKRNNIFTYILKNQHKLRSYFYCVAEGTTFIHFSIFSHNIHLPAIVLSINSSIIHMPGVRDKLGLLIHIAHMYTIFNKKNWKI